MLVLLFLFGASVASFITSCCYRLGNNCSLIIPQRSYCDNCHSILRWWHLIPIFSFIILRGQCFRVNKKLVYICL